jgi:hypothetical protein
VDSVVLVERQVKPYAGSFTAQEVGQETYLLVNLPHFHFSSQQSKWPFASISL